MRKIAGRLFSSDESHNDFEVLRRLNIGSTGVHLAGVDARFITDDVISEGPEGRSEQSFAGSMAPHRPDDWMHLLSEAGVAYDKRTGPRRLAEAKRQKLRQFVIRQQHKAAKSQKYVAHMQRQQKLRALLLKVLL